MSKQILFNDFQIKSIINSTKHFDIISILPYGSIYDELNYCVFFNFNDHLFATDVKYYDFDFHPFTPNVEFFTETIVSSLKREIRDIDRILFSPIEADYYIMNRSVLVYDKYINYIELFKTLNNFLPSKTYTIKKEDFCAKFVKEINSGQSPLDFFNARLFKAGVSKHSVDFYSNKQDISEFVVK